jgi:hypothetical protein
MIYINEINNPIGNQCGITLGLEWYKTDELVLLGGVIKNKVSGKCIIKSDLEYEKDFNWTIADDGEFNWSKFYDSYLKSDSGNSRYQNKSMSLILDVVGGVVSKDTSLIKVYFNGCNINGDVWPSAGPIVSEILVSTVSFNSMLNELNLNYKRLV